MISVRGRADVSQRDGNVTPSEMGILYQSIKYKGYYVPNAMSENTDADARTGYTATCEYEAEKSTTGDNDYNQTCDDCGKAFHAYEVPGRTVYKCNDCKV